MKLTLTSENYSGILRNERSAIIGQFWYDIVEVEKIGGNRRKVSFFQYGKLSGYIIVDEVEYKNSIVDPDELIHCK